MARTIEEHQAAFAQAGADGHKQAEAFGEAMTDLIDARAEVERLTKALGPAREAIRAGIETIVEASDARDATPSCMYDALRSLNEALEGKP